jgi:hypothetical protein
VSDSFLFLLPHHAGKEKFVPPRGISSPGGDTVLLPLYAMVSCWDAETGKPGADCAAAIVNRALRPNNVLPNMLCIGLSVSQCCVLHCEHFFNKASNKERVWYLSSPGPESHQPASAVGHDVDQAADLLASIESTPQWERHILSISIREREQYGESEARR